MSAIPSSGGEATTCRRSFLCGSGIATVQADQLERLKYIVPAAVIVLE
jgi:hypothetical protein